MSAKSDPDRPEFLEASAQGTFRFWSPFPMPEFDVSASARALKDHGH